MSFFLMAIFNLLFTKLRGGILNLDLSYNSLAHHSALSPRVSAFLSIPDAEFDILNIFIKLIFRGMHYHLRQPTASAGPAVIARSERPRARDTAAIIQQSPGKGAEQEQIG